MRVDKATAAPTEQKKGKVPGLLKRMGQVPLLAKGQYLGPGLAGTPAVTSCRTGKIREWIDRLAENTIASHVR